MVSDSMKIHQYGTKNEKRIVRESANQPSEKSGMPVCATVDIIERNVQFTRRTFKEKERCEGGDRKKKRKSKKEIEVIRKETLTKPRTVLIKEQGRWQGGN